MARQDVTIGSKKYRPYLPLGTKSAHNYGVGSKIALLDLAKSYRLPVPASFVLFDTAYHDALDVGLIRVDDSTQTVVTDRADRLISSLNFPNFNWEFPSLVALRAAFSDPELALGALSGGSPTKTTAQFRSILNVNALEPAELASALCEVWSSALHDGGANNRRLRRDILFMAMVQATMFGAASTEAAYEDDLVGYQADGTERQWLALPKLGRWSRVDDNKTAWQGRLQRLLRSVRTYFSNRRSGLNWVLDWADDGSDCWLLQLSPVEQNSLSAEIASIPPRRQAK